MILAAGGIPDPHATDGPIQITRTAAAQGRTADRIKVSCCFVERYIAQSSNRCAVLLVGQLQGCPTNVLVVVDLNVVPLSDHQVGHREGVPSGGMICPVVDNLLTIDPNPHTIIREHSKGVVSGAVRLDLASGSDGERIAVTAFARVEAVGEVDPGFTVCAAQCFIVRPFIEGYL